MDSARVAHSDAAETADSEAEGRCQLGFTLSVTWQLRGIQRFFYSIATHGPTLEPAQKTLRDGSSHAWKPPPSLINAESIHEPTAPLRALISQSDISNYPKTPVVLM